jgi:imidazolonepropionase-like amidohydrolase
MALACWNLPVALAALVALPALAALTPRAASADGLDLVVSNVRVFTGEAVLEQATVTVHDGVIVSILPTTGGPAAGSGAGGVPGASGGSGAGRGASASVSTGLAPTPAVHLDGAGRTLVPGLIDAHVHLISGSTASTELAETAWVTDQLPAVLQAYLDAGVTTVKSAGDSLSLILGVRDDLAAGALTGPRLLLSGKVITAPGGHPAATLCGANPWCLDQLVSEVGTPAEAEAEVDALAVAGVDAIKFVLDGAAGLPKLTAPVMNALVARAQLHGLPISAHVGLPLADALTVVATGVDGVDHMVLSPLPDDALALAMLASGARYVPTLVKMQAAFPGAFANAQANLGSLHADGVTIVLGTDTAGAFPPGQSTLDELVLLVGSGLTPREALEAGTVHAAAFLGLDDVGVLAPGKRADLVLVDGDPLTDITDMANVVAVMQAGRVVAP